MNEWMRPITITMPMALVERIEKKRGKQGRSEFVREIIEKALK